MTESLTLQRNMAPEKVSPPLFVTGYHAIEEYLRSLRPEAAGGALLYAASENKRARGIAALARKAGVAVRPCTEKDLEALPAGADRRGLVLELRAQAGKRAAGFEQFLSSRPPPDGTGLVLALDGVSDVHNLGALLRSADLFCVDAVLIPGRRTAKDSGVVAKISSGASAFVPLFEVTNLVRGLAALKDAGFWIYGADMDGGSAQEAKLTGNAVLVLGSEGAGLSRLVRETCDQLIRIPTGGHVDSFNVSVAGGILMYEVRRQQGFPFGKT
jgi:23S rRNA (guanosine2251-2'-O)-methyltransferase